MNFLISQYKKHHHRILTLLNSYTVEGSKVRNHFESTCSQNLSGLEAPLSPMRLKAFSALLLKFIESMSLSVIIVPRITYAKVLVNH